jgi:hypothetical protein
LALVEAQETPLYDWCLVVPIISYWGFFIRNKMWTPMVSIYLYDFKETFSQVPTHPHGPPAIEWIIDQYQVKTDRKSGIIDDPNGYSDDEKYIFNLLLRIINVSVQTVDLINSLPPLEIEV